MIDEFEILGVARDATVEEIRRAYSVRILECSRGTCTERAHDAQLVREAYRSATMKHRHANANLVTYCTLAEISSGMVCRCGSKYKLYNHRDNIAECETCSCYLLLMRGGASNQR